MAVRAIANRMEIFGTITAETLALIAERAVEDGAHLPDGRPCASAEDVSRAGWRAARRGEPLVLTGDGEVCFAGIEAILKQDCVPYQVVRPEESGAPARLFDGIAEFEIERPVERGMRLKVVESSFLPRVSVIMRAAA